MRIEIKNVQIKFSSRLNCVYRDVRFVVCFFFFFSSVGCRTFNYRRQFFSEFNQLKRVLRGLMDKRNGNRRNFFIKMVMSSVGRIQRILLEKGLFFFEVRYFYKCDVLCFRLGVRGVVSFGIELDFFWLGFCFCRILVLWECRSINVLIFVDIQRLY